MRGIFGSALALAFTFGSNLASAYECTPVRDVRPALTQAWTSRCIPYFLNDTGALLATSDRPALIAQSWRVWTDQNCTDLELRDRGTTLETPGFDPDSSRNRNVIYSAQDASELDEYFSDRDQLAVTLTSHSVATGEIFDADIVFNDVRFNFADVTSEIACVGQNERPYDLRNTLIHEMGHFIGFDHDTDPESTMLANAQPCEIQKRTLTSENKRGVCEVYPSGQDTATCAPPAGGYDTSSALNKFRNRCDLDFDEGDGSACSCRDTQSKAGVTIGALMPLVGLFMLLRQRRKKRPPGLHPKRSKST
ncbi:MAG: matrixin family metalloprotease [Deltaproteobacteria bacterium]|nr:matrixin family metalloprotease [Deltaproteobacteria bacterium]